LDRDLVLWKESLKDVKRSTLLLTRIALSGDGGRTGLRFDDSFKGVFERFASKMMIREFLNFFEDIYGR
jgi:hypothetical protein